MEIEERTLGSSLDVSQSSNESPYFSPLPMAYNTSVLGVLFQEAIDIIGHETKETEAIITITHQELDELRNRQAITESVLNNLLCSTHGKPAFTSPATQAP